MKYCLVIASLLIIAGCTVGPDFKSPQVNVPAGWVGPTSRPTTQPGTATTERAEIVEWWRIFNDPTLDSLVHRALDSNLDLQQAELRIRQARASRAVVAGGLWPSVDASASYRRSRSGGGGAGSSSHDLYKAGFDAAWELDVFGGVRRSIEAADADVVVAIEDRRDVLVTMAAEVALNYMDLRGFQRQIAIANKNLDTERKSLDLTRRRFAGGFVSGLDVANAEADVATNESRVPLLESSVRQVIYSLSVLLGREPGALLDELTKEAPLPTTPPPIPIGLPSDLLRRRPDIRRAEAQIHAATARVGVATADLFPRFSLTGSLGISGNQPKQLATLSNGFWSIGPSVSWPIFDAGRIHSGISVQSAIQEETILAYQSTVLVALRDVENALIAYSKEQQHQTSLTAAVDANRRAVTISTQLYTQGQTDFSDVLLAQRSLLGSEDAQVQSERALAQQVIALFKALGGGWEIRP